MSAGYAFVSQLDFSVSPADDTSPLTTSGGAGVGSLDLVEGNLLIAAIFGAGAAGAPATFSDSSGNTWTAVPNTLVSNGFGTAMQLFYAYAAASGNATFTAVGGNNGGSPYRLNAIYVGQYSGLTGGPIGSNSQFQNGQPTSANGVSSLTFSVPDVPAMMFGFASAGTFIASGAITAGTSPLTFTGRTPVWETFNATNGVACATPEDALVSTSATEGATFTYTPSSVQMFSAAVAFAVSAPPGAALVASAQGTSSGTAALTTGPAPFTQIVVDNPSHAGGSTQINMGSGPGTGTGDTLEVAFTKIKQDLADANTMFSQLFPVRSVQAPTTGFDYLVAAKVTQLILNPAGTLAAGTVTFPPNPGDNQPFAIMTTQTITALTVNTADGSTLTGAPSTISASGPAKWLFNLALNSWLRA